MMSAVDVEGAGTLADLHRAEYRSLVRLAAVLGDRAVAEEIVQDAFVRTHVAGARVRDPLAYVRRAVINGARSSLRRRRVRERAAWPEAGVALPEDHREVIDALRRLPRRQRECLVLRYYLDLSEADIAAALGISTGSVKQHSHRGLAALQIALKEEE